MQNVLFGRLQPAVSMAYSGGRQRTTFGNWSTMRRTMRWKPALNAFAITFADRFLAAETY